MMEDEDPIVVPHGDLPEDTLRAIAEDFCSRDGTDYAETELTLPEKVAMLMGQLRQGEAHIVFEATSQSLQVVTTSTLPETSG